MNGFLLNVLFWLLIGIGGIIVALITVSALSIYTYFLFFPSLIIFFFLGIILLIFSLKEKNKRKERKFLILTSASAMGFAVFAILHNVFYGLKIVLSSFPILRSLMGILEVTFFLIAIFVCPLGFLIGIGGSIYQLARQKKKFRKQNDEEIIH